MFEQRLIWLDLEMTGLDPHENTIIEIATIVTEGNLDIVAEGPSLAVSQPEEQLDKMDEWNQTHHTENGLINRVRNNGVSMKEAEEQTLEFLRVHCLDGVPPLCGNTIGQDRRFLRKYMPELHDCLLYTSPSPRDVEESRMPSSA